MFGEKKNMFGENKDKLVSLVVEKSTIGGDFTIEGLVNSAGEVDLAILLWLGRGDQVQLQSIWIAVASQLQLDLAGQFVQV